MTETQTFGGSLDELLPQIREALGPDAVSLRQYIEPVRDPPAGGPGDRPQAGDARAHRGRARGHPGAAGQRRRERREEPEDDGLPHVDVLA